MSISTYVLAISGLIPKSTPDEGVIFLPPDYEDVGDNGLMKKSVLQDCGIWYVKDTFASAEPLPLPRI